ncbi:MAG: hypothetical protein M5U19_02935 [Microthrixaceae bacterium]|nr:hypothetical protein [Microthrixaceae bacterium]
MVYVGADFMEYRFIVILTPLLAMLVAWLVDRFANPVPQVLLVSVLLVFSLAHRFVVPPVAFPRAVVPHHQPLAHGIPDHLVRAWQPAG